MSERLVLRTARKLGGTPLVVATYFTMPTPLTFDGEVWRRGRGRDRSMEGLGLVIATITQGLSIALPANNPKLLNFLLGAASQLASKVTELASTGRLQHPESY